MKIADMHCDTIGKLYKGEADRLFENHLHVDLQKMQQGDYMLQNFAMFVDTEKTDNPFETAMAMIDLYYRELEQNADLIRPVRSFEDIVNHQADGKMSALLTLEEGAVVKGNPAYLRDFYRLGARMMTLTWNYRNEIGVPNLVKDDNGQPLFQARNNEGLTEKGIEIIQEMERLGMIIDVSHLSDGGFWDVVRYTKTPFVASHSNAAAVCNVFRNMTDDMIRALSEHGGVMGLNFCGAFLTFDGTLSPKSTIEAMVRHVRHIVNVGGIEVCGLGTDFDGIPDTPEVKDASQMQLLAEALCRDGFHESEVEKICYGNVMRLYRDVL